MEDGWKPPVPPSVAQDSERWQGHMAMVVQQVKMVLKFYYVFGFTPGASWEEWQE